ncbi:20S-pre-rRNA D-site endonuclease nob1 [Sorochytrium milnesiophthora]
MTATSNDNQQQLTPLKARTLVLDTAPLLKNSFELLNIAETLITIPEVLAEVRDRRARQSLAVLPCEIQVRQPSEEAMAAVSAFARRTGDFAVLSVTDIKVLALTYTLEKEANGGVHLRAEPMKPVEQTGRQRQAAAVEKKKKDVVNEEAMAALSLSSKPARKGQDGEASSKAAPGAKKQPVPTLPGFYMPDSDEEDDEDADKEGEAPKHDDDDDDDDGGGWITVTNLSKAKERSTNGVLSLSKDAQNSKPALPDVACITSDFAMQNVLLQMNMCLISLDGIVVKQLKNWLLRCHACFKTTHDMDKRFCPSCGNATLLRTSYSIDQDGNVRYHLRKNYRYNTRGTIYSIPNTQSGRKAHNLILREDQKEFQVANKSFHHLKNKAARRAGSTGGDIFDADYIPRMLLGGTKSATDAVLLTPIAPTVGHGRRNPNESKKRVDKKKRQRHLQ